MSARTVGVTTFVPSLLRRGGPLINNSLVLEAKSGWSDDLCSLRQSPSVRTLTDVGPVLSYLFFTLDEGQEPPSVGRPLDLVVSWTIP